MWKLGKEIKDDSSDDNSFDIPDTPKALKCPHGFAAQKAFNKPDQRRDIKTS